MLPEMKVNDEQESPTWVPDQDMLALLAMFEIPIEEIVDAKVLAMLTERFETCVKELSKAQDIEDAKHIMGRALKRTFLLGRWSVRH